VVAALPDAKQALAGGRLSEAEFDHIRAGGAETKMPPPPVSLGESDTCCRRRKTGLALGYASYTYAYYVLLTGCRLPGESSSGEAVAGGFYTMIRGCGRRGAVSHRRVGDGRAHRHSGTHTRARRIVLVVSMLVSLAVVGAAYATSVPSR